MEEYKINIAFWKHHDVMRQKKMENFLTVNSILAAAIAFLVSGIFSSIHATSFVLIIGISIMGFFISLAWNSVMRRNSEYMRFQRLRLCSIEQVLPQAFTTFTKMYSAFSNYEEVHFSCSPKPFKSKTKSANELEGALPKIMAAIWVVVAISCVAFLIYTAAIS